MDDAQMAMDLDVQIDDTSRAWLDWVEPTRQAAQVQKFLERVGLRDIPAQPWPEDSVEVRRLDPVAEELFPNWETATAPESADLTDAFVCFIGECFGRWAHAKWINYEWFGRENSFYERINPALEFDTFDEDVETAFGLVRSIIEYNREDHDGMFSRAAAIFREYVGYVEEKRHDDAGL
ncbi:hypothetical protein ACFYTQ_22760 [Nocardia sp. NPDC004068]|uniref:hypothetical protein n=1 Tax=Nocardia sp. NPDC004068 TaxID=3364303 RepID=UPI0036B123AD